MAKRTTEKSGIILGPCKSSTQAHAQAYKQAHKPMRAHKQVHKPTSPQAHKKQARKPMRINKSGLLETYANYGLPLPGTDPELDFGGPLLSFSCEKFLKTIICCRNITNCGAWPPAPSESATGPCLVNTAIDRQLTHLAGCFVSASVAFARFPAS